uniref:ProQ/FINO family protein n=1 Tax=Halomonas sp. TaxID=1486246 RepID=UPI0026332AF7|nr:ProQ/FINO family protein [Halomonas sp.]
MIQTHAEHPLDALEQRTATLLDGLREGRKRQSRLEAERDGLAQERDALVVECDALTAERDGLVQERDALAAGRDTLVVERDALVLERDALSRQQVSLQAQMAELRQSQDAVSVRIAELEAELAETQAQRQALFEENSELAEENRELDEQNRELEAHNARLRERAEHPETASSGTPLFSPPVRRAQGLAALMQHRPRHHADDTRLEDQREKAPQVESRQEDVSSPVQAAFSSPQPAMPSSSAEVSSAAAQSDMEAQGKGEAPGGVEVQSATEEQGDKEAGSQADLPIDKAPSPQSLLEEWYKRYDQTFFKGHTRPLKIGIHEDLAQREPWPEKLVRRALACYVNLPRYLKSVREGADRIDLDGAVDGKVDAQAAEHAKRKLDRLQSERRKNSSSHHASRRRGEKPAQQAQSENKQQAQPEKGQGASRQHAKDESRVHKTSSSQQSAQKQGSSKSPKSLPYSDPAQNVSEQDLSPEQRMQLKLDALMARHNAR